MKYLTVSEVAALLGVQEKTVQRYVAAGKFDVTLDSSGNAWDFYSVCRIKIDAADRPTEADIRNSMGSTLERRQQYREFCDRQSQHQIAYLHENGTQQRRRDELHGLAIAMSVVVLVVAACSAGVVKAVSSAPTHSGGGGSVSSGSDHGTQTDYQNGYSDGDITCEAFVESDTTIRRQIADGSISSSEAVEFANEHAPSGNDLEHKGWVDGCIKGLATGG